MTSFILPSGVVNLTDSAVEYFETVANGKVVHLSLYKGGCTAFQYFWNVDETSLPNYTKISFEKFTFAVDDQYIEQLKGSRIDYVKTDLSGSLVVSNPNVSESCGCNESFKF